ncbi:MAG: 3'3'-cGAMP-specific phosphodiesterase 2 [Syntrophus sp. SKADARSKE-3]|nr:3'3'-cGAMP-specific phosphodiesterase 2 [Syntrophus sp. SKADARSKE-3]
MGKAVKDESVLVVEDDPDTNRIVTELVTALGFQCTAVKNKIDALDILVNRGADIVIADINTMEGIDIIRDVRAIHSDVPFMVITGYARDVTYDTVVSAGANDFIKKPFTSVELKNKLNRIMKERRLAFGNQCLLLEQVSANMKISSLLEIALDLTAEVEFDHLFHLIVSRVTKVMNAERTSLYLIDWDRNEIWTKVAEQVNHFCLPIGEGISGLVAKTGETINVADAWELSYFKRDFDLQQNFRTKAVLCMPINNRAGERIAVIQVLNKQGGGAFNNDDVSLLRSLASQMAIAIENAQLVEELKLSFESSIRTLSATVDAKHHLTAGHSERVTEYALIIARQMGLGTKDLEIVKYAGLLHDIGKIGIKDAVLLKYGPFTAEERAEMEVHTVKTKEILENFRFSKAMAQVPSIAAHHHERFDGRGYPDKLKGEEIPLCSRVLAAADVFDALTSQRDYPKYTETEIMSCDPMPLNKVVDILKKGAGAEFDPVVISAFLQCMDGALLKHRGKHFPPEYVDKTIENLRGIR